MQTAAAQPDPAPATLEEALAALAEAKEALAEANEALAEARGENADLRLQLDWFKRNVFGRRSEKRISDLPQPQETLFEAAGVDPGPADDAAADDDAADDEAAEPPAARRRRRGPKRRLNAVNEAGIRFSADMPVRTVVMPPEEAEGIPDSELEQVGEHVVNRLVQRPASYEILRIVTPVLKRRGTGRFLPAGPPPAVLERSCADVSVLAGLLTDKFVWHLPLHRQHQRMKAAGVMLARQTLTNWAGRAIDLLGPVRDALWESVLESRVLAMDETAIRAGRTGPGKMRAAKFWPVFGDRNELVFHYAPDRAHRRVPEFLGDFSGVLLSDGYQAYEQYAAARGAAVALAQCWSHTRRNFEALLESGPAAVKALELIWELYRIERIIRKRGLEGAEKLAVRREQSVPAMARFWEWHAAEAAVERLPKDPFLKALNYAGSRRAGLEIFLSDPDVPIDTTHLERGVRPIACGRKNWLFAWTEDGAERIASIQSLLFTCALHGVDPYVWLVDVLQRVSVHPMSRVRELTPREWKTRFAGSPMRSLADSARPDPAGMPAGSVLQL